MEIYQSVILGIVQGLTELLPISSSAHLNIIPWMFGWINNPGFAEAFKGFDVALHFGTLLAIAIYFFKDWLNLIKGGFDQVVKKKKTVEGRMFWYIVLATIPGGIIGFVLYFRIYYKILRKMKKMLNSKNTLGLFFISYTIVILFMEPYSMSYISLSSVVILASAAGFKGDEQLENEEYTQDSMLSNIKNYTK